MKLVFFSFWTSESAVVDFELSFTTVFETVFINTSYLYTLNIHKLYTEKFKLWGLLKFTNGHKFDL